MKTSPKLKTEILNAMRHQLSINHMDSLEYPNGEVVGRNLEKNTQAVFDVIEELPDYAIHNTIAKLRGDFRSLRRFALENFDDPIKAMEWLYNNMMAQTKLLLPYDGTKASMDALEHQDNIGGLVDFYNHEIWTGLKNG